MKYPRHLPILLATITLKPFFNILNLTNVLKKSPNEFYVLTLLEVRCIIQLALKLTIRS